MNWDMNSDEHNDMDYDDFEKELKKLKASDFYFQLGSDGKNQWFDLTPKPYYDMNKCQIDIHLGGLSIIPPDFDELLEASFEYNGDPQVGRQLLLNAGFIEKKMF